MKVSCKLFETNILLQGTRLAESNFINNTSMVFGLCLRVSAFNLFPGSSRHSQDSFRSVFSQLHICLMFSAVYVVHSIVLSLLSSYFSLSCSLSICVTGSFSFLYLCFQSLLEHQKKPKKALQKHFQNSLVMLPLMTSCVTNIWYSLLFPFNLHLFDRWHDLFLPLFSGDS